MSDCEKTRRPYLATSVPHIWIKKCSVRRASLCLSSYAQVSAARGGKGKRRVPVQCRRRTETCGQRELPSGCCGCVSVPAVIEMKARPQEGLLPPFAN